MSTVTFIQNDAVGIVTLDRPLARHAVNARLMEDLRGALDAADAAEGVRVLVVTASGDQAFCAGGDLDWFSTLRTRDEGGAMCASMSKLMDRLAAGHRPVIAAQNGDAWGGGAEILCACHLRVAADDTRIGFRQAAMGLVTGWGGGARLMDILGPSRALDLLLTGRAVPARESLELGLLHRVVPRPQLMAEALALAVAIAQNAPDSLAALLDLARTPRQERPMLERRHFLDLWTRPWFRNRLDAWTERP
jgi:enoyl-CoA hydratase